MSSTNPNEHSSVPSGDALAASGPVRGFSAPAAPATGPVDVPHRVLAARDEIAAAIQESVAEQAASGAAPGIEGPDNVQGVAIGLSGDGIRSGRGEQVLTVYIAEPAPHDDVRVAIVDGMAARSAADLPLRVVTTGIFRPLANTSRVRPAPGGFSASHFQVGSGTLGCLAKGRSGERRTRTLAVSCAHVFANPNSTGIGDCVVQPGMSDGGTCQNDEIALLEYYVPIDFTGAPNAVDCATAWCWPDRVRPEIGFETDEGVRLFNISGQLVAATPGMPVRKSGRTTGLTQGVVTGTRFSCRFQYANGVAYFADQIAIENPGGPPFAQAGDSGSCVYTWDTMNPTGLLFGGAGGVVAANPMAWVVAALDIDLYTH
ncbi:hypothetical protein [Actinomadura bangladeshensis]|uniref:Trypsin-like peptidase domain-containing protein n=1 Tax=Actinomadura bangladeshensis TaxID=453573 RepID=A0A4R4NUU4_9ACTN|nr:hypothetical protein [Actinomadura bangladeshensis]TDC11860.1 hypothetical protein E1284_26345 [Actinomadura bangladeshensis]